MRRYTVTENDATIQKESSKDWKFFFGARAKAFAAEEDGTFVAFGLFIFLVMFLIGGIAVDIMNTEHRRVHLQNTLDNAVLASANLQQDQEPKLVIEDYFSTSGLRDALDPLDASGYTLLTGERKVNGSAGDDVPTNFMRLIGIDTFPALAYSEAEQAIGVATPDNREVSVVIDISGSMRENGRVDELREATKNLMAILLKGTAATTTSVNLIPYSGQVNPGPEMFEILGGIEYGTTGGHMHAEHDTFPDSTKDISNVVFYYDNGTGGEGGYDYTTRIEGYPGSDVALIDKDDLDSYVYFADAYFRRQASGLLEDATFLGASWKAGNQVVLTTMNGGSFDPINTAKGKDQGTVDYTLSFGTFYGSVIAQFSS